jgi:membrane protein DedA with SNARE-associated domain
MLEQEVIRYITEYGIWIVFAFVFVQEIGIPTPIPNEVMLLFAGFFASEGTLSFPLVFLAAVAGDIIGTSILFFIFNYFGHYLFEKKPKWFPLKREDIKKIENKLEHRGRWGIFLGRLLPYARGYVSVAAGLLQVDYKVFISVVVLSAVIWSGGYVTLGYVLGDQVNSVIDKLGGINALVFIFIGAIAFFWIWRIFHEKIKTRNKKQ